MANIRLKELLEANVDPKLVARSKESGKLVYFKTPQAKDAALKAGSHVDPKSKKGAQPKASAKPNDMFGGDYAKDRGGEAPKADPVIAVASRAQQVPKQLAGWADKNGVDLSKVSDALSSGELNVFDFRTAVSGIPGNKYAKDVIAKYSQSDSNVNYSQSVKQDIDGQTDDELYDALYDMGYDFGELGSDDFDEEGFADAAMNLGYRWDEKNKVWNHRDDMDDTDGSDVDGQSDEELYNALSDMGYDFGKFGSKNFDEEGFADAAVNLGYRYDDENKVWNHRDAEDGDTPKDDVDVSDYSTDGQSAVLYKGKKVGDYMYDDITDEFTLKTKDGIKAFDTHEDMYKYLHQNPQNEKPSLSSKLMSMIKR
jgi:hypothetical protein